MPTAAVQDVQVRMVQDVLDVNISVVEDRDTKYHNELAMSYHVRKDYISPARPMAMLLVSTAIEDVHIGMVQDILDFDIGIVKNRNTTHHVSRYQLQRSRTLHTLHDG